MWGWGNSRPKTVVIGDSDVETEVEPDEDEDTPTAPRRIWRWLRRTGGDGTPATPNNPSSSTSRLPYSPTTGSPRHQTTTTKHQQPPTTPLKGKEYNSRLLLNEEVTSPEEEEEEEVEEEAENGRRQEKAKASLASSIFNLVNNIIGGGVLALPFVMKNSGLILGSILLAIVALLSVYSARLLLAASRHCPSKTLTDLSRQAGGKKGAMFMDLCNCTFLFGGLVGYMVIIGDVLTPFMGWLGPLHHRSVVVGAIALFCIVPLCLLRKIKYLQYTSVVALGCIIYLVSVVVFRSIEKLWKEGLKESEEDLRWINLAPEIFKSLPIMSFAFTFHSNVFPVFNELKDGSEGKMGRAVLAAVIVSAIAYYFVAIFGYLTFLDKTEGNIFTNYNDDILVEIGKVFLGIVIIFSYPLLHFPARLSIDNMLQETCTWIPDIIIRYVSITVALVGLSYLISVLLPDITVIFGLFGATAGNIIVFSGPAMLYIILTPGSWKSWNKVCAIILAVLGIAFGIISFVVILVDEL
jgi:amino acid permease